MLESLTAKRTAKEKAMLIVILYIKALEIA